MRTCRPTSRTRRAAYYAALGQPADAAPSSTALQAELTEALTELDRDIPRNPKVRHRPAAGGSDLGHPLEAQPEPRQPGRAEGGARPPLADDRLLDVLKETDLRVGFTDEFTSAGAREALDRDELRRRLLLCLYGLGTNTGLKRVTAGRARRHLQGPAAYVRRRFIDADSLRDAAHARGQRHLRRPRPARSGARARPPAPPTPRSSAPGTRT